LHHLLSECVAETGVILVSAPAGSGKTVLLKSWLNATGLNGRAAWVSVERGESSPQNLWRCVIEALKRTIGAESLRVTPTPALDGNELISRLLSELNSLEEPVVLTIDDLHELKSSEALGQIEVLIARRPPILRIVLSTRRDPRIGLHRLRLAGELTEIRASDLRFNIDETRELLATSGIELSDESIRVLQERTEGWAAGLRLAALSLVRHPEPEKFVAEFCGSERMVADYLLAEVLERQPEGVRRLLLRTSILERVHGALADIMVGEPGSEAILQELEDDNAFVVSLDAGRSWFRYHHLLAELLQLELRKREPAEVKALHSTAAQWFSEHGFPLDAVRHAQAAEDWKFAARLLSDSWFALYLDGNAEAAYDLLSLFPPETLAADPELISLIAARELNHGSLETASRYLTTATASSEAAPEDRRERLRVVLAVLRLSLARQRGDVPGATEEAQRTLELANLQTPQGLGLGEELRALALIGLGFAEIEAFRIDEAESHLQEGLTLARRMKRPFLELTALLRLAITAGFRSLSGSVERAKQALEIAEKHGWTGLPGVGFAYWAQAMCLVWQARMDEAEPLLELAEQRQQPDVEPGQTLAVIHTRAMIDLLRDDNDAALKKLSAGERLASQLGPGQVLAMMIRRWLLPTLARLGETDEVERAFAQLDETERSDVQMRLALAWVRVIQKEPAAASLALQPIVDGSLAVAGPGVDGLHAFLMEAIARDTMGEVEASERALERALDLAEPDESRWAFLLHPVREMLERHRRTGTAHAAFVADLLDMLAGSPPLGRDGKKGEPPEHLSESELRVLRFLPSNLSAPEIAAELFVSTSTVKTHMRHIYGKLSVHGRSGAVARARELGLLAPVATLRR
jgi:LuxR family maltose regulon positive regulatory protein